MPRQIRIEFQGAWYHVMNRGISRKTIFHTYEYYQLFFDIISKTCMVYPFEIHAYCFMSNHYHLLIRTPEANLGKIMRKINGDFAQKHNFLQKSDGPLFKGRYKAILVDSDEYLLELNRYIHLNPVKANIVASPENYFWSSYNYYLNPSSKPTWLCCDHTMSCFNYNIDRFKSYIIDRTDENISNTIEQLLKNPVTIPILGSDNFINSVQSIVSGILLNNESNNTADDASNNLSRPNLKNTFKALQDYFSAHRIKLTIENIIIVVSKNFDTKPSIVQFGFNNFKSNIPRKIAIYLTYKMIRQTQKQIGEKFGNISRSQVGFVCCDIEKMLKKDPNLNSIVNKIISDIKNSFD